MLNAIPSTNNDWGPFPKSTTKLRTSQKQIPLAVKPIENIG
jgi:hypothetical protein